MWAKGRGSRQRAADGPLRPLIALPHPCPGRSLLPLRRSGATRKTRDGEEDKRETGQTSAQFASSLFIRMMNQPGRTDSARLFRRRPL